MATDTATITRQDIVKYFNGFLNDNYYGAKLLDCKMVVSGKSDGMTYAEMTYHRGKPEHVTHATYGFRREDWDNRIVCYF